MHELKDVWSDEGGWMKGLTKVFSSGSVILNERRMKGLLKGYMQ